MFGLGKKKITGPKGQKALADNLRDEQRKSEIILNAIEDGVVLLDADKTIQLFNPGAAKITGWAGEEAVGLDFHSVIKLVDNKDAVRDEATHPFNRVFEEDTTIRDNNATLLSQSNHHISLSLSVSPLHDESGKITAAVAVFRDVSEERKEERQRAEFISTASHEMRTPVAAIEGYLALALNERVSKVDAKARSYLEKAHESTQHLGKLFQDLLTSAKAEDGRLVSHPVVVEMGSYLEQLSDSFRFSAQKKGLLADFIIGTTPSEAAITAAGQRVIKPLYYVQADPDRLREVITNLFDNAVKYTPAGKISLGLTGNSDVVQLFIRDTGPGIPPADIPHLFQKFYRVDSSATRTIGGTGLGLFISRKIVELYQGRIWVESELNKGSTFYINLPRLSTAKAEELMSAEAQNLSSTPIASLTTPVV
jgi:PAS domain S-box-containing protein